MKTYTINKSTLPREKMLQWGAKSLTRVELLMVMLGRGVQGADVGQISSDIEKLLLNQLHRLSLDDLIKIPGMGEAKSLQVLACIEFSNRLISSQKVVVNEPGDVWPVVAQYGHQKQEYLVCVTLNGAHEVITHRVITIGLLNQTQIHPREVFVDAISDRAAAIILVHNHPSGSLEPSPEDIKMTEIIQLASKIIGIKLLDHLIINDKTFYSFVGNQVMTV